MPDDGESLLRFWMSDPHRYPWWRYRIVQRHRLCRSGVYLAAVSADAWLKKLLEFINALRKTVSRFARSRRQALSMFAGEPADVSGVRMLQLAMDNETFRYQMWRLDPVLAEAYRIFLLSEDDSRRSELEARILARQDFQQIAGCTGYKAEVIEAYAACFFDVLDRIDQVSYILHQVIFPSGSLVTAGQLSPSQLLRAVGYFAGPEQLQRLVAGGLSRTDEDAIRSAYEWQIRFAGWLSALSMPSLINRFNVVEVARVAESAIARGIAAQTSQEAGTGSTAWDKAMLAVMEGIPWSVGPAQELHLKESGYEGLNKVGQEPRAGELLAGSVQWQERKERLDRKLPLPQSQEQD